MKNLNGKIALVTGGGKGIGSGISKAFLDNNATVIAAQRTPVEEPHLNEVNFMQCDLQDMAQIDALVNKVLERYGRIDILVNNAGINKTMTLETFDAESWNQMLAVNLTAPLHLTSKVSRAMKKYGWGRIINISSISIYDNTPFNMSYGALKAGIHHLTKSWGRELARYGITVNSIVPGFAETDLTSEIIRQSNAHNVSALEEYQRIFKTYIPSKRTMTPKEIGEAAVYLCSQAADNIIGQNINISGGEFMPW